MKPIDLVGKKFGYLTVESLYGRKNRALYWNCRCICGKTSIVQGRKLRDGLIKSCGCMRKNEISARNTKHGFHGEKLYATWKSIKQRCYNKNSHCYKDYGGRGIEMCCEWRENYSSFRKWALANGYKEGLTIERIDVNGNYSPGNCTWIPLGAQAMNRRTSHYITVCGERMTITQASKKYGINRGTLSARINRSGWDEEKAALTREMWRKNEQSV